MTESSDQPIGNVLYTLGTIVDNSHDYARVIRELNNLSHMVVGTEMSSGTISGQNYRHVVLNGLTVILGCKYNVQCNKEQLGGVGVFIIAPYKNGSTSRPNVLSEIETILGARNQKERLMAPGEKFKLPDVLSEMETILGARNQT